MIRNTVTFQRIEEDMQIGKIRSATVDHERGMIILICDSKPVRGPHEGSTIPNGQNFTTERDEERR